MRRALAAAVVVLAALAPACRSRGALKPECSRPGGQIFVLAAQSVPTATLLPCVRELPAGWGYGGFSFQSGRSRFWLNNDRAGMHAVEVDLTPSCVVSGAAEVTPAADEAGTARFEKPISLKPGYVADRFYVFPGGCVTYRFRFEPGASSTLALEAEEALSFASRAVIVRRVEDDLGLSLCGAGAPPCAG